MLLFFSCDSKAALTATVERGLCFDRDRQTSVRPTKQRKSFLATSQPQSLSRDSRHWLAMKASELVEKLSDLERSSSAVELLANYTVFRADALSDYEQWRYFSDEPNGIKYSVFAPLKPKDPWVIAFNGTPAGLNWMLDAAMGRLQMRFVEKLALDLISCDVVDRSGVPIAARNWIITGHGLGGGLAQAFAFKVGQRRSRLKLMPGHLELVTFNGFGAGDLLAESDRSLLGKSSQMRVANYFVSGDVFSRFGKHVGATYKIPRPTGIHASLQSHSMRAVEAVVMESGTPRFGKFMMALPPESRVLEQLKELQSSEMVFESLSTQGSRVRSLEAAVENVVLRRAGGQFDRDFLRYIHEVISNLSVELENQSGDYGSFERRRLVRELEILKSEIISWLYQT
jgi:hypothetical protein